MEIAISILVLCTVPTIISMLIQLRKEKYSIYRMGKVSLFYLLNYCGVMCFVKILSGEGVWRLVESFDEIVLGTFLHYGVPYIVIAVVAPILLKLIFRKNLYAFMEKMLSVEFICLSGIYFLEGIISNISYVISIVVGAVAAIAMLVFGKEGTYCKKNDIKKIGMPYICAITLYVVTVVFYMPNEMVITNLSEFLFKYTDFLYISFVGSLIVFAFCGFLGIYLLSKTQIKYYTLIIFSVSILGYIQGMLLNGKMTAMDGTIQTWVWYIKGINLVIWGGIIAVLAFLLIRKEAIWRKIVKYASVYVCLIQIASFVILLLTTDFEASAGDNKVTKTGWTQLHSENNVVVFVLDWYDNQILNAALEQDEKLLEPLKDFTYYPNTTSRYAFTQMSVPYLLTGIDWIPDMTEEEYINYAFAESSFLQDIEDSNYKISMYTEKMNLGEAALQKMSNYLPETSKCKFWKTIEMTSDASRYKMAPFIAKEYYGYASSDFNRMLEDNNCFYFLERYNVEFYDEIRQAGLSLDMSKEYDGAFSFYHLTGVHAPYEITRDVTLGEADVVDEAIASLKIVYAYIEEMKANNIYDNATIIITADHGSNYMYYDRYEADRKAIGIDEISSPILFVKEANQMHEDGMLVNEAPVSHQEFQATVIKAVNGNYNNYGRTFDEIDINEQRERIFEYYRTGDTPYVKYLIDGDTRDKASWHVVESAE
ncbi:MAG: hypothetical protein IJ326_04755 [Lachnospiraceae bacterium]|nr:hypothetical protein [Lachnospiraceae bacterium]